jgi:hypothetical protein
MPSGWQRCTIDFRRSDEGRTRRIDHPQHKQQSTDPSVPACVPCTRPRVSRPKNPHPLQAKYDRPYLFGLCTGARSLRPFRLSDSGRGFRKRCICDPWIAVQTRQCHDNHVRHLAPTCSRRLEGGLAIAEQSHNFESSLASAEKSHYFESRELVRVKGYRSRILGAEPSAGPCVDTIRPESARSSPYGPFHRGSTVDKKAPGRYRGSGTKSWTQGVLSRIHHPHDTNSCTILEESCRRAMYVPADECEIGDPCFCTNSVVALCLG